MSTEKSTPALKERISHYFSSLSHNEIEALATKMLCIIGVIESFIAEPVVPGYEPMFEAEGLDPVQARLLGKMILHFASKVLDEQKLVREGVKIILAIARGRSTLQQRARLLALFEDEDFARLASSYAEDWKIESPPGLGRIHQTLLDLQVNRNSLLCLVQLAKESAPQLPQTRGRHPSVSHVAHRLMLQILADRPGPKAYTFGTVEDGGADASEDHIDARTKATREAIGREAFNPQPARRGLVADGRGQRRRSSRAGS